MASILDCYSGSNPTPTDFRAVFEAAETIERIKSYVRTESKLKVQLGISAKNYQTAPIYITPLAIVAW
jgi:hypothetical protein